MTSHRSGDRFQRVLFRRQTSSMQRFANELDVIKFLCKDFWDMCFLKKADKLQTNHRVRMLCDCMCTFSVSRDGDALSMRTRRKCSWPGAQSPFTERSFLNAQWYYVIGGARGVISCDVSLAARKGGFTLWGLMYHYSQSCVVDVVFELPLVWPLAPSPRETN